jgi:integrase
LGLFWFSLEGFMGRAAASQLVDLTTAGLKDFAPVQGVEVAWDRTLKGFGLRTRGKADPASWSWVFKYLHKTNRKSVKVTLGRFLTVPPDKARKRAVEHADAAKVLGADLRDKDREARDAAKAEEAEDKRRAAEETARPTVDLLWTRYWDAEGKFKKAANGYGALWTNHLKPAFGTLKVRDVTPEAVEEFKAARVATPGACNRALSVLSAMMTKAVAWGWRKGCAPEHPVKGGVIRRYDEKKVEFTFTVEELGALLQAADGYASNKHDGERSGGEAIGLVFRMLATTGARASEVLRAHWGQFAKQPDGRLLWTVEATNTKQGRAITRSLDADLSRRVLEWQPVSLALTKQKKVLELGGPRWVFPNARDPSRPVPRVENAWQKIKTDAGLSRAEAKAARIHDLRHTVASHILQNNGGDLSAVKEQLGHATILTTQRYAHVMPQGVARTGDLMGAIAAKALAAAERRKSADVIPLPVAQEA